MTANTQAQSGHIDQNPLQALLLMSCAMLVVPCMDIIAKYLSSYLHPLEVTLGRFVFQSAVCLCLALFLKRMPKVGGSQPVINFLRGVLLATASLCFFVAIKYMSVATAVSIFFVEPMILTVLAALILKEKVGPRRIAAVAVGLAGALIILRPNVAEFGFVSLLPIGTAVFFALYLLVNRLYPVKDDMLTVQLSAGFAGSIYLGGFLLFATSFEIGDIAFVWPNLWQIGLLVLIGLISFGTHGLVVAAFQRGSASLLAPLQYLEIVSATLFGYLVFSDFPDLPTWIGISLIIGSGLYIAHRERVVRQRG
jgi:drug/metabolite transporter (DMT)-like permease